jgi:hypothetical protein
MALKTTGSPNNGVVQLNPGDGLRYTVQFKSGAVAVWVLDDEIDDGISIMDPHDHQSKPFLWKKDWYPGAETPPTVRHTLLMVFAGVAEKYHWKIERIDANGAVQELIRDVDYEPVNNAKLGRRYIKIYS